MLLLNYDNGSCKNIVNIIFRLTDRQLKLLIYDNLTY